tara:strand:+ start:80965 stop:81321 length:357 start_codon:yes stop_codon:yes gene_type:complete
MSIFAIAAGGAIGALGRYGVMSLVGLTTFPYATILVNVIGSLALGALVEANALFLDLSENTRLFLVVGLLGGFTTFSTFSMDSVFLLQKGEFLKAGLYMVATLTLTLASFMAGMWLIK